MKKKLEVIILTGMVMWGTVISGKEIANNQDTPEQHKSSIDFDMLIGARQREWVKLMKNNNENKFISKCYKRGPYLVYDCERGNYACVDKDGFQLCKDFREQSIIKKNKVLSCAPLKKFDQLKLCIKKQKELVDFPVKKYFCLTEQILRNIFLRKDFVDK
jgi:hypothetical protein